MLRIFISHNWAVLIVLSFIIGSLILVQPVNAGSLKVADKVEKAKVEKAKPVPLKPILVTPTKKEEQKPTLTTKKKTPQAKPYTAPVDLNKVYVSSEFSYYHPGVDLAPKENQGKPELKAIAKGTVIYADNTTFDFFNDEYGGYGKTVVIDHHNGLYSLYAHLHTIEVKKGQKIEKSKKIGKLGTTGNSTGPHLHIEVCSHECKATLAKKYNPSHFFDISHLPRGS